MEPRRVRTDRDAEPPPLQGTHRQALDTVKALRRGARADGR
jgi:hypothetical protein